MMLSTDKESSQSRNNSYIREKERVNVCKLFSCPHASFIKIDGSKNDAIIAYSFHRAANQTTTTTTNSIESSFESLELAYKYLASWTVQGSHPVRIRTQYDTETEKSDSPQLWVHHHRSDRDPSPCNPFVAVNQTVAVSIHPAPPSSQSE